MAGRCNASQDAQDAWDAGDASLASGRNADGSDAGSVFADELRICYQNQIVRKGQDLFSLRNRSGISLRLHFQIVNIAE